MFNPVQLSRKCTHKTDCSFVTFMKVNILLQFLRYSISFISFSENFTQRFWELHKSYDEIRENELLASFNARYIKHNFVHRNQIPLIFPVSENTLFYCL